MIPLLVALYGCAESCPEDAGLVCTIAGTGVAGFSGEGADAKDAMFYRPMDVASQPGTGAIFVADWNNHKIRRMNEDGTVDTVVGTPLPGDGPVDESDRTAPGADGTTVSLNHPVQLEFGPDGILYLPNWHNHKVRTWDPETGKVLVIVADTGPGDGNGANAGFRGDEGPAVDALLAFPNSIAFGPDGTFFLVDEKNERIRSVTPDGNIHTVAGTGQYGLAGDDGDPLAATFAFVDAPTNVQPPPGGAIETDEAGNLYIADTFDDCVRKVDFATHLITQVASGFDSPSDLELGPDGRLYVMDSGHFEVVAIDLDTGATEVVLGTGEEGVGDDGVPAIDSALGNAHGIDFDADGALLVADTYNNRIRRVNP